MTREELLKKFEEELSSEEASELIQEYLKKNKNSSDSYPSLLIEFLKARSKNNVDKKNNTKYNYDAFYHMQYSLLPDLYYINPFFLPTPNPETTLEELKDKAIELVYQAMGVECDVDLNDIKVNVINGDKYDLLVYHFDSSDYDIEPLAKYIVFPYKFYEENLSVSLATPATIEYIGKDDDFYLSIFFPVQDDPAQKCVRKGIAPIGGYAECIEAFYNFLNTATEKSEA